MKIGYVSLSLLVISAVVSCSDVHAMAILSRNISAVFKSAQQCRPAGVTALAGNTLHGSAWLQSRAPLLLTYPGTAANQRNANSSLSLIVPHAVNVKLGNRVLAAHWTSGIVLRGYFLKNMKFLEFRKTITGPTKNVAQAEVPSRLPRPNASAVTRLSSEGSRLPRPVGSSNKLAGPQQPLTAVALAAHAGEPSRAGQSDAASMCSEVSRASSHVSRLSQASHMSGASTTSSQIWGPQRRVGRYFGLSNALASPLRPQR